jgi:hypothetical protein
MDFRVLTIDLALDANHLALQAGEGLRYRPKASCAKPRRTTEHVGRLSHPLEERIMAARQVVPAQWEISRCRLRKALPQCDKSRSSQVDRGLPYPPGRGTAGSTRICVGDTCSSEIVNDPPHFDTSPRSGRYESFRRTIERFINPTLAFFSRGSFRRVWNDSHAHSHAPAAGAGRHRRAPGRDDDWGLRAALIDGAV